MYQIFFEEEESGDLQAQLRADGLYLRLIQYHDRTRENSLIAINSNPEAIKYVLEDLKDELSPIALAKDIKVLNCLPDSFQTPENLRRYFLVKNKLPEWYSENKIHPENYDLIQLLSNDASRLPKHLYSEQELLNMIKNWGLKLRFICWDNQTPEIVDEGLKNERDLRFIAPSLMTKELAEELSLFQETEDESHLWGQLTHIDPKLMTHTLWIALAKNSNLSNLPNIIRFSQEDETIEKGCYKTLKREWQNHSYRSYDWDASYYQSDDDHTHKTMTLEQPTRSDIIESLNKLVLKNFFHHGDCEEFFPILTPETYLELLRKNDKRLQTASDYQWRQTFYIPKEIESEWLLSEMAKLKHVWKVFNFDSLSKRAIEVLGSVIAYTSKRGLLAVMKRLSSEELEALSSKLIDEDHRLLHYLYCFSEAYRRVLFDTRLLRREKRVLALWQVSKQLPNDSRKRKLMANKGLENVRIGSVAIPEDLKEIITAEDDDKIETLLKLIPSAKTLFPVHRLPIKMKVQAFLLNTNLFTPTDKELKMIIGLDASILKHHDILVRALSLELYNAIFAFIGHDDNNIRKLPHESLVKSPFLELFRSFPNLLQHLEPHVVRRIADQTIDASSEDLIPKCCVCHEPSLNATECSHFVCVDCLKTWRKMHDTCPICRRHL